MSCSSCGRTNPAHARFCGGCGLALVPRCASCGAECEPDARFCTACGSPRDAEPAARPSANEPGAVARKVVTVVFADLIGSVALHERLDAESGRRVMEQYHRAMTAAVELHGGRVVQLLGDGVLAVFGVPRIAEDDAIRAVRAGVGMQRAYREMVRAQGESGALAGVGLRVAVNTGEMVVGDDETVIGDTTNVAARLQHEARDGDVIVGEGTQRLVEDLVTLAPLGAFALRGRAEAVRAWRAVSLDRPASTRATPFVGREPELGRLRAVWQDAVASRGARLAVLLGSPGLGKSRLVAEIARRGGERATVLSARCDAAGGATFAPIADALRPLLRVADESGDGADDALRAAVSAAVPGDADERARIASGVAALFTGAPSSPEETFFAVRRLLAAFAAERPVVLMIDDLHWAPPLLLDLVEHLVQWSTDVPLLVLAAARPELRDVRASLARPGGLVADVVTLGGLDAASSMQLAAGVVGAAELPAALVGRVLATSEGNPLFLAELVRMLVQDGVLRRDGERWTTTVEVAALDMPPTIHVLLAARIERLRPEERAVLERAAVVGRQFSRAAVAHLAGGDEARIDACLEALERSELVESDTGWFLGEPALRFHHALIRDAAYRRVLKETRAELHERLAEWIAVRLGDAAEHEETLGWHLEQAHLNLRELGPLDARGRALGEHAARHLGAAGRRALARDDLALAAALLGRAIAALEPGHGTRTELVIDRCEALLAAGEVEAATDAIAELERVAAGSERLLAWHACFAGQLAALIDPQSLRATADRVAAAAEVLAADGDAPGEAKAHAVHASALARLGAMGACEAALDRALAAARRARDRRRSNSVLAGAPVAALWGPSPVTRASGRCLDVVRVLRITQGAPAVESVALRCQAVLEALRGRGEAARRMVESARRLVEELGIAQQLLEADVFAGMIELLEGDAAAAERFLASAYAGLREHGLAIDAARAASLLGRALLAQDRAAEAEALSHDSESLAGDDLKAAIAWRGVRAEALARRGDAAAAVELASAAVEIAAATDALLDHADARIALAAALRAAGRDADADAEERRAADLWRAKGATLLLARTPHRDQGASAVARAPGDAGGDDAATARFAPLGAHDAAAASPLRENFATAHVRRLDAIWAAAGVDAFAEVFARDLVVVHHAMGATYGYDESVLRFREMFDGPGALDFRHEPLATLGDAVALCRVRTASGGVVYQDIDAGAFEIDYLVVVEADADARAVRVEVFASDRLDDALARAYALHADAAARGSEGSRAAAIARAVAAVLAIDVDAIASVVAPDVAFADHRSLGLGAARDAASYLRGLRSLTQLTRDLDTRTTAVLAAHEHALLLRRWTTGVVAASGGAFELDLLVLWTFDDDGRIACIELFEPRDAAAALASARSPRTAVTAGMRAFADAFARRDWDALADCCAPGLVTVDHRRLGWEPLDGSAPYVAALRALVELAPDTRMRLDHVETEERGFLVRTTWVGTRDGGPFEEPSVMVGETDADGRVIRFDQYDPDGGEAARERFAAIVRPDEPDAVARRLRPNAAVVARDRLEAALRARDWTALREVFSPDAHIDDRRPLFLGKVDASTAVEVMRNGTAAGIADLRVERRLQAVFGERVALEHQVWSAGPDDGRMEIEMLALVEADPAGRVAGVTNFDVADRRAAFAEGYGRWAVLEPRLADLLRAVAAYTDATSARDLARTRALLADDFSLHDWRRTGLGLVEGPDAFLATLRATWPLVRQGDVEVLAAVAIEPWGALSLQRIAGALTDGGSFESLSLCVMVFADGRYRRAELFEVDDDRARSRFDELRASVRDRSR